MRSKFAHGIADLVTSTSVVQIDVFVNRSHCVVMFKILEDSSSFEISCNKIVHSYTSRFHAFVYLDELRRRSYETTRDLRSLEKCRNWKACEIEGEGWLIGNDDDQQQRKILKDRIERLKQGTREKDQSLCAISRCVIDALHINSSLESFRCFADSVTGVPFKQTDFDENRCQVHLRMFQEILSIATNLSSRLSGLESCLFSSLKRSQLRTRDRRLYSDTTIALSSILSILEFASQMCDLDLWRKRRKAPRHFREIQRLSRELASFSSCCYEETPSSGSSAKKGKSAPLFQFTFLRSKSGKALIADSSYHIDDIGDGS